MCEDPERCALLTHAGAVHGWVIESFHTAEAAVRRSAERAFDAVTVCGRRGEDAVEVARRLRASLPHAPLVLVVDHAGTAARAEAARCGVSEVLLGTHGAPAVVAAWEAHRAARAEGARVVVVSADAAAREAAEAAFAAAGSEVRALAEGGRFFEELAAWRPEAVVLDLDAPPPSAWDLLHAMRASAEWREVPVVLIGARIDERTRRRASAAGAEAVVELPAAPGALAEPVHARIRRARLSDSRAARPVQAAPGTGAEGAAAAPPAVVLVDGSTGLTELLRYACPHGAGETLVFHDGPAALRFLLGADAPRRAVVVLDLDLPGVNGTDGVRRLAAAAGHDYRVVATTTSQAEGDQVQALRAGAVECLVKPLSLLLFTARLERLLDVEGRQGRCA